MSMHLILVNYPSCDIFDDLGLRIVIVSYSFCVFNIVFIEMLKTQLLLRSTRKSNTNEMDFIILTDL